ncbi:MAG: hypothetical protein FJY85_10290 [Deltaproteobacteria bacterium]|nr:hypothetical protein [Deltaproteobacteria bacterium]
MNATSLSDAKVSKARKESRGRLNEIVSRCDRRLALSKSPLGAAGFSARAAEKALAGLALSDWADVTLTNELAPTPIAAIMITAEMSILPLFQDPFWGLQHEDDFPPDD